MSKLSLPHNHNHNTEKILENLPKSEEFQLTSDMFRLLSDCSRIRIFWILCHCEECVINLSAMVEMSSPAVSHHLKLLKSANLITSRREGKEVYYKAADNKQAEFLHNMLENHLSISCPSKKII